MDRYDVLITKKYLLIGCVKKINRYTLSDERNRYDVLRT